jgi:photosystem II stability/assembly factor-like uncharacterized protein
MPLAHANYYSKAYDVEEPVVAMICRNRILFLLLICCFAIALAQPPLAFSGQRGRTESQTSRTASSGPVDEKLFGAMRWRQVGPFRGGRVLAVTGVPGEPNVFYFGGASGGVWKSTDTGANWQPLFDRQAIASIGAIAVAPSDHNIIYVGTGEACIRGNISYGNGVYKSMDGGKTWKHLGLRDTRHIGAVIVDPRNPNIVFVAALGHAYGPNEERGVFRSTDGGATWQKVSTRIRRPARLTLFLIPTTPILCSLHSGRFIGHRGA